MRLHFVLAVALLLGGCTREPTEVRLRLALAEAIGCQPTAVQTVLLRPLGDSPAASRPGLRLDLSGESRIDSFVATTEQVAVRAEGFIEHLGGVREPWVGTGFAVLDRGGELVVPLLRVRRGCALSDTRAGLPTGASVAALDDGRLLIAGGDRGRIEALRLVVVRLGDPLARTLDLDARPRLNGSLTPLGGDLVLVAGGLGRESFEVIRVDAGEITLEGLLRGLRSEHGATRLADGRVLLVGGRSERGGARRDAEIVEIADDGRSGASRRTVGELSDARIAPTVLSLDDGTVLVLGGVDDAGDPLATVERFEPETETFTRLTPPWGARLGAEHVALAGGRVARLGGRVGDGWFQDVSVLLERGQTHVSLGEVLYGFERPRGVSLGDGRLLVVGAVGGEPAAQIVDPGGSRDAVEAELEPIDPERIPSLLVRLADGTIAEIDADGVSLLNLDIPGPFHDPDASINPAQLDQRGDLSLDAVGRWVGAGDVLVGAVDGARLDLPSSRFARFTVELDSVGAVELLLTPAGRAPLSVTIDDREARFGPCVVPLTGPTMVEREGSSLRLSSGGASTTCELPEVGRLGVAVRASLDAGVRRLVVTRR